MSTLSRRPTSNPTKSSKGKPAPSRELHKTYASLLLSVAVDCYLCRRIHQRLGALGPAAHAALQKWKTDDIGTALIAWSIGRCGNVPLQGGTDGWRLRLFVNPHHPAHMMDEIHKGHLVEIGLSYPSAEDEPAEPHPQALSRPDGFVPAGTTDDEVSWTDANRWMKACLENHELCRADTPDRDRSIPWFPTRLLDISRPDGLVRLIDTKETPPISRYVSLSHCWGHTEIPKLTRANMFALKLGLPKLNKTFEHAIFAARKLNVSYIWIDSLCIIQDDPTDWATESAQMCDVYENALCNIAATASSDGDGGLFRTRHKLPCEVNISIGHGLEKFHLVDDSGFYHDIARSPLLKRGWVIQERTIARRVLHFGPNQLFWECNELSASQSHLGGSTNAKRKYRNELMRMTAALRAQGTNPSDYTDHDQAARAKLWINIIASFSRTKLTKNSDKLPALSGIVKNLKATAFPGEYHAGIWSDNAHRLLAWMCRGRRPRLKGQHYRAPTWSWVSADDAINLRVYSTIKPILEILEIATTPATDDPTGSVSAGHLLVQGKLTSVSIKQVQGEESSMWTASEGLSFEFLDTHFDEPHSEILGTAPEAQAYLLPLYSAAASKGPGSHIAVLILREALEQPGNYERIGLGWVGDEGGQREGEILAQQAHNWPDMPCEEYLGPDIGHRIKII